ncbi:MAG: replication factor C small subunit [Nanoarchaeota archaeon]|nr:replication factor C small subunit [Nanoarchaeota archaeon]MBU1445131.1 replication factor C small subunit [Nanoarchaeota archaeon]MBU2420083.1 replication factor C small subunit [Nanoarchaeota archaeon]MBU2475558.1 replication factor C small subunit [Nanoarchaeota archaeon]MBU3940737.1 replication factor C small subunit [Nanoarchaeota archaeon]
MSTIWTEKYRPQTFDEIKGQDKIVDRVKAFVDQKNMPHLLFAGPAGVGKTTLSLVIAKQMFKEDWQYNFLELNASDERGIDIVRNKIKDFARTKSIKDVPFKIIYLDECDSLTKEAQQALRRTMENYTNTCRFILSCNYSSKILDPIQSRCTVFRFKPLEEKDIKDIIKNIAHTEKLKVSDSAIKVLIEVTGGDARRLENILQSCSVISKNIDDNLIFDIVSAAKPKEVLDILKWSSQGEFIRARDLLLDTMLKHGLSGFDIIKQIQKEIWSLEVEDKVKLKMSEKCGETEFRMVEGSDEFLQLESMLASFALIGK